MDPLDPLEDPPMDPPDPTEPPWVLRTPWRAPRTPGTPQGPPGPLGHPTDPRDHPMDSSRNLWPPQSLRTMSSSAPPNPPGPPNPPNLLGTPWPPPPPPHRLRALAHSWLDEDAPWPDPTVAPLGNAEIRAHILVKNPETPRFNPETPTFNPKTPPFFGVLAGCPFAEAVFAVSGCSVLWKVPEGSRLGPGRALLAEVRGPVSGLLLAERTALNVLGRCSGVASMAARARGVAESRNWGGVVAGTRKCTPGFRAAEKYALGVGGAQGHREGLGAFGLVKDNHRAVAEMGGGHEGLIVEARRAGGFTRKLGVECASAEQALEAAKAGADVVLLDNLSPEELHAAAARVKAAHPRVLVEASGGIGLESLGSFLGPHVDVVSMGCLTHSAPALDFALKVALPRFLGPHGAVMSMGCPTHSAPALDCALRVLGMGDGAEEP
ncbi:nicotinate-nucleotide pyrophosphorylase [carboxylating]-like [Melospiza georgiana]|uniref:nicotinate-nucleotide pyrophosphorylase [carboxylating]-like n=1 Tax=Melospiza georgiana TaxID=44398 RepID=UPI0025AB93DF|nr:nicotinate-nucleotide pyrophosphorylase [carboxylating]-like [Melospiza georgiana]